MRHGMSGGFIMNLETADTPFLKQPSVFANHGFMLLFSGKVISLLGDQIYAFALSWYVLEITKSSLTMSIFLVINALVGAVIAPLGGIIADRVNRKNVLVWMDVVRGIIVIIVAVLLYFHLMQIWMLYVSAITLAICGAVFSPAASSIIPNIVKETQLTQASSLDQFIVNSCCMGGMLISGVLYNLIGIVAIFLLNALSYLISAVLEAGLKMPFKLNLRITNENFSLSRGFCKAIAALVEGSHYVKTKKWIVNLTLMYALFNLIVFPYAFIYLTYTYNVIFHATPLQLSVAIASAFIGNMIGSLLVQMFSGRYKIKNSIFWGLLIWSFCIFLITSMLWLALKRYFTVWDFTIIGSFLAMIGGIAFSFCVIPINVIFQKNISDEYRGRFWGFLSAVTALTMAIGFLLGGFLAQKVWMVYLFLSTAIGLLVIDLWIINTQEIKTLKDTM
jgi:Arabinose efflux permease